jgi:hypothetical protein
VGGALALTDSEGDPELPAERDLLTASDLTFLGQQNLTLNYSNMALALRYVDGQRRFLSYIRAGADNVGDLVEYREHANGLKNGASHWTTANVPSLVEVRRWKNWSTRARMVASSSYVAFFQSDGGNGVWPSSFYWDEAKGCLWYTWQPVYPGGGQVWPAYSATYLDDAEAVVAGDSGTSSNEVSDGNIKGPFYYKNAASTTAWKTAASGIIEIPSERQAQVGATLLNVGHHAANIGADGARSLSIWMHDDLPTPGSPDETICTEAEHIWDTGTNSGAVPSNQRMPNFQFMPGMHSSNSTYWSTDGATAVETQVSVLARAAPLATDSLLEQHEYGDADCLCVYMNNTSAAGGAWVPEIYGDSGWVVPTDWAMAAGNQQLSALANVFYWPKVNLVPISGTTRVRLRQTGTGTNGGSVKTLILTESMLTSSSYPDRPGDPDGTYNELGTELYDATHYSTAYSEYCWGGAWVRTDEVEGLAYFGPLGVGAQWYGGAPAWFQPLGGGVPTEYHHYKNENFTNGNKSEGPKYPYFWTFDHTKLIECANNERSRDADGLQPEQYWRMPDTWSGIIWYQQVNNPLSPFYGEVAFYTYGNGSSVVYDPVTKQIIVWLTHASEYNGFGIMAFFQVRG